MRDRNLFLIFPAAFLRTFGVGLTGVVLGIYLSRLGFSATQIGLLVAGGLAGVASATAVVSLRADRFGRRQTLVTLAFLGAAGGFGLVFSSGLAAVFLLAFAGMVNGMGRDRGPAFALDQAILANVTSDDRRTWALAWYNVILDAGHALGALAGVVPYILRQSLAIDLLDSYRVTFAGYAALNLLSALCYLLLSSRIEVQEKQSETFNRGSPVSPESRPIIVKLAALAGLDSLGGGFLTATLVAYWFFQRFGVSEESLGPLFFLVRVLNGGSYLAAAWLARKIGLVNTMVFTHIPSSLLLLAIPFAPSFGWAVFLLLARESLVEMDVPTRQSYIVAVVKPSERTFASGMTTLTRNVAWAVGPSFAGYFMQHLSLSAPLFLGGGIKIAYDFILYFSFRRLKPPEERNR